MNRILLVLLLGFVAAAGGLGFIYSGFYDVAALRQHTPPTYWAFITTLRHSIRQHSTDVRVPRLKDRDLVDRGLALYREHCVPCHGAPGVPPEDFGKGLTPAPNNLVLTAREWSPAELYWTIENGIKMTGMPAWRFHLTGDEMWALVALLQKLPTLSPAEYRDRERALDGGERERTHTRQSTLDRRPEPPVRLLAGDVERGRIAIRQYACHTCHAIPGVTGADKLVGPPLGGIAVRRYLAGVLPNRPQQMMRWIQDPQRYAPGSAMPDMGVSDEDARDIVAYLYTLR